LSKTGGSCPAILSDVIGGLDLQCARLQRRVLKGTGISGFFINVLQSSHHFFRRAGIADKAQLIDQPDLGAEIVLSLCASDAIACSRPGTPQVRIQLGIASFALWLVEESLLYRSWKKRSSFDGKTDSPSRLSRAQARIETADKVAAGAYGIIEADDTEKTVVLRKDPAIDQADELVSKNCICIHHGIIEPEEVLRRMIKSFPNFFSLVCSCRSGPYPSGNNISGSLHGYEKRLSRESSRNKAVFVCGQ